MNNEQPLITKYGEPLLNSSKVSNDLHYLIGYYKRKRIKKIRHQIEREDLQHKHAIKRMQCLLAKVRGGSVISKPSVTMDTDQKSKVVVVHQVSATSTIGGYIDQSLNIQAVKQQIEMEGLQHKEIIKKMQSLLESVELPCD